MSHAAVIPRDVFLFQLLAVAQAYVVLTDPSCGHDAGYVSAGLSFKF